MFYYHSDFYFPVDIWTVYVVILRGHEVMWRAHYDTEWKRNITLCFPW